MKLLKNSRKHRSLVNKRWRLEKSKTYTLDDLKKHYKKYDKNFEMVMRYVDKNERLHKHYIKKESELQRQSNMIWNSLYKEKHCKKKKLL